MPNRHSPDPRLGLFETLLVAGGTPVALADHLDRLGASARAALGMTLPESTEQRVLEAARGIELGRLRLTARPAAGTLALALDAEAEPIDPGICLPAWERGARVASFELPGGLGEHKWRDRSALPPEGVTLPLLLDRGEEVLEASRANVFAVRRGALFTPPLDGRVLPGTTRAKVLELAAAARIEVRERPMWRAGLLTADEVFLTGSVRGIEPVRALDGVALGRGPVAPELARRLASRWRLGRPLSVPVGS